MSLLLSFSMLIKQAGHKVIDGDAPKNVNFEKGGSRRPPRHQRAGQVLQKYGG